MSQPRPDNPALPDPRYHWTTYKARAFTGALAQFRRVAQAARSVGMCRQSAYRLRARLGEEGLFARSWNPAPVEARVERAAKRQADAKATPLPRERDIFGIGK